eukprot:7475472-Pyramimonas_sp.AAC.1
MVHICLHERPARPLRGPQDPQATRLTKYPVQSHTESSKYPDDGSRGGKKSASSAHQRGIPTYS